MSHRLPKVLIALLLAAVFSATPPANASSSDPTAIDPTDSRLVPNPIDTSDPGTTWSCNFVGSEVQCSGVLKISWQGPEGPIPLCSVPLYSVNGHFARTQTRHYAFDAATGRYLEYKRLIHLVAGDSITPTPDPASTNYLVTKYQMTWLTSFHVPGDNDSRVTRKQGVDTFVKRPDGGIVLLDVGQRTEDLTIAPGEDFDFRGRYDVALGAPDALNKICTALGI